ncbi:S53 family serine peptidase [soil metagenome]
MNEVPLSNPMAKTAHDLCALSTRRAAFLVVATLTSALAAAQSPIRTANPFRSEIADSVVPALAKSQIVSLVDPSERIGVTMALQPRDLAGLQALADAVSDPRSSSYQRFVTPKEIGDRFGARAADRKALADYFAAKGLTIDLVASNGLAVTVSGTAAQMENAFGTALANFQGPDASGTQTITYRANTKPLTLPVELAKIVTYVSGLETNNRPQPRATTTTLSPNLTSALYGVSPSQSAGYYGAGRNVAISNFDGFKLSNVPYFITQFGLPYPSGGKGSNITVTTVGTGAQNGTAQGEGDLDIQMVIGQSPLANLRIYDSKTDLLGVLSRETSDNWADVITESYGWNGSASSYNSWHNQHVSMTAQGITYMAASGDSGTNIKGYPYPDFEPEVLQVGGTIATVDSTSGARQSEIAWNYSGGGWYNPPSGVTFDVLPSWQHGTGVPTTVNRRLVPDIAFHAAANNSSSFSPGGYYFAYGGTGSFYTGDGTSFASPVFAGGLTTIEGRLYGSVRTRLGRLQNTIYAQNGRSDVYTDIKSGTNGKLPSKSTGTTNNLTGPTASCTTGWDYVTGWGPINLNGLYVVLHGGP